MKELIKYFVNLLILQFRNKPKAKATIETLAEQTFSDSQGNIFPIEVQGAYSLDTAVGKQLDVIGKYIGYDRVLSFPVNNDFRYEEYDGSINPEQGYSEYFQDKDTFPYAEYRYTSYDYYNVKDEPYRKILKMISLLKNKPLSLGCIDEVLEEVFEGLIYVEEGDKSIEYHIAADLYSGDLNTQDKLNQFFQKYFPRPMGCTMTVVRDPFYLNLQTIGGAEDYIDENFIYTRTSASGETFLKTFNGFNVGINQNFEMQVKIKIDSSYTSSDIYYTAINGDTSTNDTKYDFGLEKRRINSSFSLIDKNSQGQVQYIDLLSYTGYTDTWVTINLKREIDVSAGSIIATMSIDGTQVQQVDSHWGMAVLENAYFVFGVDLIGSIDFKECWIKQNNVMTWKGITNKKPKGV